MLSKKFYKYFGLRVEVMKFGLGTYYQWDKEKQQLRIAQPWQLICMYSGLYMGGVFFTTIHVIRLHMKTHVDEIPEEGMDGPPPQDLRAFATLIIECAEILLVICLSFLNIVFLNRVETFMFLFNEMLDYNKKLAGMIESGKMVLTKEQKNIARLAEFIMCLVMIVSVILPFGVAGCVLAKIEPTHQLIREWLEVDFKINLAFSPLIGGMMMAGYGVGSTVSLMMIVIAMYYTTSTVCTNGFTPENMKWTPRVGPGRCKLETVCFGWQTDEEVMLLYRTQQILNKLLNEFFKSVLISFHHVGCLATVVVLLVFMIRYNEVMDEYGPIAYALVSSCIWAVLTMIFFQAKMAGDVVDISDDFKFSGRLLTPRKFMFRKFSRSCSTFYIQVAYPFYTVHKETFSEFCQQIQDYSMELLLW